MDNVVQLPVVPLSSPGAEKPLLIVAPSLGTSVSALWGMAAKILAERFVVIGVDLPGHGVSRDVEPINEMSMLAKVVLVTGQAVQDQRGKSGQPFYFAGVSVSGCIGLQLLLDAPEWIAGVAIINSAAKIGEKNAWLERAALVRSAGTESMLAGSLQRWFAPGFADAQPERTAALLDSLVATKAHGYAAVCEALADFDIGDRLHEITRPALVIGGENDVATPPTLQEVLVRNIAHGRMKVFANCGHLAPAEHPDGVANMLLATFA